MKQINITLNEDQKNLIKDWAQTMVNGWAEMEREGWTFDAAPKAAKCAALAEQILNKIEDAE